MQLYGCAELLPTHEAQLQPLLEKANSIDPEYTYLHYLGMGYVYEKNQKYEQAYDWYMKAIELDETQLKGYIAIGQAALAEKDGLRAENALRKAIAVGPRKFFDWLLVDGSALRWTTTMARSSRLVRAKFAPASSPMGRDSPRQNWRNEVDARTI